MELRQLRYFVKVCETRSLGKAAIELGVVTSALSQQMSRLESELSTRLLQRGPTGVAPTESGLAFLRQAQLTLRHADEAVRAAQQARLSGHVNVGLAPTTASVLGVPLMLAMQQRYPEVRLHLVESLSGHLSAMLKARKLDLAVIFHVDTGHRWSAVPLLDEQLFLIGAGGDGPGIPDGRPIALAALADVPLILPSAGHGLRATLDAAFGRAGIKPRVVAEIDGLALLMDAVRAGLAATIQPGAGITRLPASDVRFSPISDVDGGRRNLLVSLPEEELSPAALATRVVIRDTVQQVVNDGLWVGASLLEN